MRRIPWKRTGLTAVMGVAGLVALTACGGSDSGSAAIRGPAVTKAPAVTTTQPPATTSPPTTARPRPNATTGPATTPTTRPATVAEPVGTAQLVITPGTATVGTRVKLEGSGFTGDMYRVAGAQLWLAGSHPQAGCNFFASADHTVVVTADGRISGDFVVPAKGECRQSDVGEVAMASGRYEIRYACTVCTLGSIEVVVPGPPSVTPHCADVVFSPQSENIAGDIVAEGLTCAEAEAFVRKVGGPLGPINGLPRTEADGFTCVRTSQSERGLPSAVYECTNGPKRITFVRT